MMNKMKRFLNQPIDTPLKRFVSLFVAMAMVLSVLTVTSLSTTTPASAAGGETSYKVTNDSKASIDLTIKHLNNNSEFYTADHQTLQPGDFIDNYNKVKNYNVTSVTLDNKTVSNPQDLRLTTAGSHTIVVNYQASTSNVINPVKFYDYTLHPDNNTNSFKNGINDSANYSSTSSVNKRFAIGNNNIQRKNNTINSGFYDTNGKFVKMNYWTGSTAGRDDRLGIITNLSGANYSQVNFNSAISAPKLFNNDPKVEILGLTNIDNYKLNFSRTGDTYKLTKVLNEKDQNANESYTGSSDFFPLNHVSSVQNNNEDKENGTKNVYFGMRYDFTFTLGDYNGPLNYTFNGDDDLWVFLDGQLVLDDGGIHGAIEKSVNIKEKLGSSPDKSAVHQITVLYMERGGNESNCSMEFTIPNLTPINYQEAQKIDVEFRKQNAHQEALAGAKFSVVDDNKVSLGEFTSDANGKVTLKDLREGTYYVTETKAPDSYVLTGNVQYKIVVSRTNDGKLTYKLYQPGENNTWSELSNNTIINKSEKEVEQESIVANKKAELVTYTDGSDAWNDRLYDITLNPVSNKKITTTTTTTTPGQEATYADIMLVLDVSGSMKKPIYTYSQVAQDNMNPSNIYYVQANGQYYGLKYYDEWYKTGWYSGSYKLQPNDVVYSRTSQTRLDALKESAIAFVNNMNKTSPDSRIGLKAFSSSSSEKYEKSIPLGTVKDNASNIINVINSLKAEGGTSPERGLGYKNDEREDDALSQLSNGSKNLKFTILFTDGSPTGEKGTPDSELDNMKYWESKNNAETAAQQVKAIPSTLYTVGFGMGTNATNWLKNSIASEPAKAYTADTAEGLSTIFNDLSDEIASQTTTEVTEKKVDITGATVVDTISKEFELTQETRDALSGVATITDNNDGTTTVTWTNQTIKTDGSTKYVLRVKAKDSYFGGNNVATNVKDNSYILTNSGAKKEFDEPHVNVKAELTAKDYKTTRFAGETFDATHVESKNNKSLGQILSPQYDKSEVTKVWKDAKGNKTTLEKMNAITTNAQYRLELSYNAGEAKPESTAASNGHYNKENMTAKGQFEINFKKGSLKITKKIDEQYTTGKTQLLALDDNESGLAESLKQKEGVTNDYTQSNQTFIYKIQRKVENEVKETFYATISFDSRDTTTNEKSVTIHNLEQGDYTVTEETAWSSKYDLEEAATANGTTNGKTTYHIFYTNSTTANPTTDGNNLKIGYREDTTKDYFTGLDVDTNDNAGYVDTDEGFKEVQFFKKAVMNDKNNYVTDQDVHAIYTNDKKTGWYWNSDAAIAINKYN
ncbi:SpaA isopeptide-forming pilin-related protein [Sharpea porci]|uniref:SpaA isopeptide-forming pilin-related protein n=1 Tax=Sharpea porci TaxID=2652286 RepID=UPI002A90DEA6|nr:SpaA isopeptide-forming pilin-related protein [Sharpea porci]MDY5280159.1 SpaA isopeptide-forming pilin-related protein [Sharpea porci]